MLDIALVEVFIQVVNAGSFTGAGKHLNLAPSSISRKMDLLETKLEATLLNRNTRNITLTSKGHKFYQEALTLLPRVEALIRTVETDGEHLKGHINISVFESFGRLYLAPLVSQFVKQYPDVKFSIELENRMTDLVTEQVDIAIRVGKPKDSSLIARKLTSNSSSLCASPCYLKEHGTPTSPEDLVQHNCLTLNRGRQQIFWHFRRQNQHQKVIVKGNVQSSGGTALLEAAEQGVGITLLANWMIKDSINAGKLVAIDVDWEVSLNNFDSEVYAVFVKRQFMDPSLRLFVDFLVESLKLDYR